MIHLIAAMDLNRGIGNKQQLLCHLPNDLSHFQKLTTNHFVVMGRKTFESIGKPLPKRTNLILTHDTKYKSHSSAFVYHSVSDILREYKDYAEQDIELFIIGGQSIYEQFLPYCDRIHLTIVNHRFPEADTYFPQFNLKDFTPTSHIINKADERNPYDHSFVTYNRRVKD